MGQINSEISEQVIQALADLLQRREDEILPESYLAQDLEVDSFTAIELLFALEDQYHIEIPDEEVENFKQVKDIIKYIEVRLQQGKSEAL